MASFRSSRPDDRARTIAALADLTAQAWQPAAEFGALLREPAPEPRRGAEDLAGRPEGRR